MKQYKDENKEKLKISAKKYNEDHKEERKAYSKIYRDSHKEEHKIANKIHYEANKDELLARQKIYRDSPAGIKCIHRGSWKQQGVIFEDDDDFDYWRDRYIQSKKCEVCAKPYKDDFDRCIDHDHDITDAPNVRQILCRSCNCNDSWKNHSEWV